MTQTYKVQVSMNQAHLVESGFVWKQGDFGFNLEIEVLDFDVTGVTPALIFRKGDGAVEATTGISVSSNKFTYTIRGTELETPGPCICDLKLKNSTTQRISTASFKYFVLPDTEDGLNNQAHSYSDTIAQIAESFEDDIDELITFSPQLILKPGYVNASDGSIVSAGVDQELYSQNLLNIKRIYGTLSFSESKTIWIGIGKYRSDGTFIERSTVLENATSKSFDWTLENECAYVIFCFRSYGNYTLELNCESEPTKVDDTLLIAGSAADAKTVGERFVLAEYMSGVNLVGTSVNTLYRVPLLYNGDSIYISRSDGNAFSANCRINVYDSNKNNVNYYTVLSGSKGRVATLANLSSPVEYIAFTSDPGVALMINYGEKPLTYRPYNNFNLNEVNDSLGSRLTNAESDINSIELIDQTLIKSCDVNLIGTEAGVLYPVKKLTNGDVITISKSDHIAFGSNYSIYVYDLDRQVITNYSILSGTYYRTITFAGLSKDVYYIGFNSAPNAPLMANYGSGVLDYIPYNANNVLSIAEQIETINKSAGLNLIGTEPNVLYPIGKVPSGSIITVSKSDHVAFASNFRVNFYSANKTLLDYYSILAGTYFRNIKLNVAADAYYIGFPTAPDAPLMANYGTVLSPYIPYKSNVAALDDRLTAIENATENTVYRITSADSLTAGIKEALSLGYKKIVVEEGEYDIIAEYKALYGNDYFDNYAASYDPGGPAGLNARGIWLQNVEILFSQGAKVLCNYTGDNENVKIYFSAFATGNNVVIDGLVADSSEVRYTIHADFESTNNVSTFKMRNCDLHNNRTVGSDGNRAFGAGLGQHSNWLIEDCIIRSDGANAVFSIHNNAYEAASSRVVIRNCYFDGDGYLDLHYSYSSSDVTLVTVTGCNWKTDPAISTNTGYQVSAWNNVKRT